MGTEIVGWLVIVAVVITALAVAMAAVRAVLSSLSGSPEPVQPPNADHPSATTWLILGILIGHWWGDRDG